MSCRFCSQKFPVVEHKKFKAIRGPSELAIAKEPAASFDAIISDPPYGTGASSAAGRLQPTSAKYQNSDTKHKLPDFAGDSLLPEAWQFMMRGVLEECYRVAKPGAELLFFCDWRSCSSFVNLIGSAGFGLRTVAVWNKGRACRPNKNGFRSQTEFIVAARKAGDLQRTNEPVYLDGVLTHPTLLRDKQHVTQKPLELMSELMRLVPPGGRILDPFQGSGTTGVAAIKAGLQYVGIEATPHYHDVAVERLQLAAAE
jgi:site-specific DNA-methyltransferase (adenine-specific)